MNKKILEQIKKGLLDEREQIINDLKKIAEKGDNIERAKFPDFGDKPDENALEVGEYTTNLATEKVFASTLRDIDNALERIKNGSYGTCKYCGEEIDEKRLLARSVASACIGCKSKLQNAK